MRKIALLIGVFVFQGLSGCKEKETGLEKNVLNTAIGDCIARLSGSLKSPSSLKLGDITASANTPNPEDIYRVAAHEILDKNGNISRDSDFMEERYRGFDVNIQYEAQNSFGVYLKDNLSCSYLYRLISDETSPQHGITVFKLKNMNESVNIQGEKIQINGSNYMLDSKYSHVVGGVSTEYSKMDKEILRKVADIADTNKVFKDFSTGEMEDYAN